MSNIIPKEQLSAYQRWEMASFGEERPAPAPSEEDRKLEAERVLMLREQAKQEGYAAGFAQGQADALEQGRAATQVDIAHLRKIAMAFGEEVGRANETIAEDVLTLALDLSKAMMKTALAIRPELVLPIVSESIRYLPTLQQPAMLVLNPSDAAIVREHMEDELAKSAWRVAEDAGMARGGCRVETPTNQIDASATVRWQRIAAALGRESDWLE